MPPDTGGPPLATCSPARARWHAAVRATVARLVANRARTQARQTRLLKQRPGLRPVLASLRQKAAGVAAQARLATLRRLNGAQLAMRARLLLARVAELVALTAAPARPQPIVAAFLASGACGKGVAAALPQASYAAALVAGANLAATGGPAPAADEEVHAGADRGVGPAPVPAGGRPHRAPSQDCHLRPIESAMGASSAATGARAGLKNGRPASADCSYALSRACSHAKARAAEAARPASAGVSAARRMPVPSDAGAPHSPHSPYQRPAKRARSAGVPAPETLNRPSAGDPHRRQQLAGRVPSLRVPRGADALPDLRTPRSAHSPRRGGPRGGPAGGFPGGARAGDAATLAALRGELALVLRLASGFTAGLPERVLAALAAEAVAETAVSGQVLCAPCLVGLLARGASMQVCTLAPLASNRRSCNQQTSSCQAVRIRHSHASLCVPTVCIRGAERHGQVAAAAGEPQRALHLPGFLRSAGWGHFWCPDPHDLGSGGRGRWRAAACLAPGADRHPAAVPGAAVEQHPQHACLGPCAAARLGATAVFKPSLRPGRGTPACLRPGARARPPAHRGRGRGAGGERGGAHGRRRRTVRAQARPGARDSHLRSGKCSAARGLVALPWLSS